MNLSTSNNSKEDKRDKRRKLREFHQPTLDAMGISDATFFPKMAYIPRGKSEQYVGFFQSEINKGTDVYVEFCSIEDVPEYDDRGLYLYKYNPHFEEEYEKTEPNPVTGHPRYLVPVVEFKKVKVYARSWSARPRAWQRVRAWRLGRTPVPR